MKGKVNSMEDLLAKRGNINPGNHKVNMEGRSACKLTGIVDVLSFDERQVIVETVDGMLVMKGMDLHVKRLSLEKGEVDIDGRVDALIYTEKTSFAKKGESLLTRLFS